MQTHRGEKPHDDGGRDWNDVATSQGTPRVVSSQQSRKRYGTDRFSLRASRRKQPC